VNVQFMQPVGEGSLKRAAALLEAKLAAEGLFDENRKRPLPYPPKRIGLITSSESAAYHDFIKILNERWSGVEIMLADVQVQGEPAPAQIVAALNYFNTIEEVDVIVMTRGGGSTEDLAAFSTESVTRAVAGSRTPTLVAIGHEVDFSLAELAADQRASTPSNAAQLLTPDKRQVADSLRQLRVQLGHILHESVKQKRRLLIQQAIDLQSAVEKSLLRLEQSLSLKQQVLLALSPEAALKRGYAIVTAHGKVVRSGKTLAVGDDIEVRLHKHVLHATVNTIKGVE
jgi:exodeoxyribonuclease VII large subunit